MAIHIIQKIAKACNFLAKKDSRPFTTAIILAAGKGTRLKTENINKQMLQLCGTPIVVHTLLAFEKSKNIDEILVVGTKEELPYYKNFKKMYQITKLKTAIEGGASRAQSAAHGFSQISKETKFVAIHDAARCLITTDDIDRVVKSAYRYGAAIVAKKATDTIKKADPQGFIAETPDRSLLWLAQTPQVFKKSIYEVSLAKAESINETITDDASLVEHAGFHVKLVECQHENIKVTQPEDIPIVTNILDRRREEESQK